MRGREKEREGERKRESGICEEEKFRKLAKRCMFLMAS